MVKAVAFKAQEETGSELAVIGMACRFPGANNPAEFWTLLQEGREARTVLSDEELRAAGVPETLLQDSNYVKSGMFLQQMEQFDAGFFGFSPLDGRILDPQHRHFLECSWEALEDAGCDPERYEGAIGVFAGSGHNAYLPYNLLTHPELLADIGFFLLRHTGNDKDFLATRASYCFNLTGPSVNVQTACSTSLVAVHQAGQSLLNGECDIALAGGVTIELPHRCGYLYKDSEILSPDGHCRPFDASAGGTVFGSGVGVVVLKRLEDAIADGDTVHAIIKASAVNNDGAGKVSYLAPSVDGQAAAVHEALAIGDIDPASVSYIECHGTGTSLGDPIEVAALTQAYAVEGSTQNTCGLGSVKSNIGHLDTAAGVASLIKVILAMKHRRIPPTLHFQSPNPAIDFSNGPFFVCDRLTDWQHPSPLRAGVSSLGVGGTNAHLIVEEAPVSELSEAGREQQLLLLSARTETALLRARDRLARFLDPDEHLGQPPVPLADAAYTLALGRKHFRQRGFIVAADNASATTRFDSPDDGWIQAEAPESSCQVAFMFAGGGAQYPNMGRELYETETVYRQAVDRCLNKLQERVDFDLRPLLYPENDSAFDTAAQELQRPSRALPALFITQYAQACLWRSWGVEPSALIGHSLGENTAACLAGVISLEDALGLVALRGQLFESVAAGSMLSVELSEERLRPLLGAELSVAAVNAPELSVASGPLPALQQLEQQLMAEGIGCRRIAINVAAHSAMLEPILAAFSDYLRAIKLNEPSIPFISNLSGGWIQNEQAQDPDYWVQHLRRTVQFSEGVGCLLEAGNFVLLEVGPGRTLTSLAALHPSKEAKHALLTSLRHPEEISPDLQHMLTTMGRLWLAGVEVDWELFYRGQKRSKVPLPTYAFDHSRCWIDPGQQLAVSAISKDDTERAENLADWFYQPTWQRATPLWQETLPGCRVLVLAGQHFLADQVVQQLQAAGADVKTVFSGEQRNLSEQCLAVRWSVADDYVHLVDYLQKINWLPTHILQLTALELSGDIERDFSNPRQRALVFDSIFHMAQAAANEDWQSLRWLLVSPQANQVAGEEIFSALPALAQGAMRVLPHEMPAWQTSIVDIDWPIVPERSSDLALRLVREMAAPDTGPMIALRGQSRFRLNYLAREVREKETAPPLIREGGVYLITGGTGGLGLIAARCLAQTAHVTLVLLARRPLPERQYWPELIETGAPEAELLARLIALEEKAQIVLVCGDVGDSHAMTELADRIKSEYGEVRGIVHTAGVIDDGLLFNKDIDQALRVLSPKVQGSIVLQQVFGGEALDFMLFYSSTSAFCGLPGQFDYAAANAFLDAYAHQLNADGRLCLSINWPAWQGAGMAAALAEGTPRHRLPAGRPGWHPLLDRCIDEGREHTEYATLFSVEKHWLLSEHRIKDGSSLIPGAGFIELARAAFADLNKRCGAVVITDTQFELPFMVGDREAKELRLRLARNSRGYDFSIRSESFGDVVEHARGHVTEPPASVDFPALDLQSVRLRCQQRQQTFDDKDHHPFLEFGPRWQALKKVEYGDGEALITLEQGSEHLNEIAEFRLHPALLDMATAGAQGIIAGYAPYDEVYVPIGYRRLTFSGDWPRCSFSHVRCSDDQPADNQSVCFDVLACDEVGRVFLNVSGFTMRRLAGIQVFREVQPADQDDQDFLRRTLELGIKPEEGERALRCTLDHRLAPQVIVSRFRLGYLQQQLLALSEPEVHVEEVRHDPDADKDIPVVQDKLLLSDEIREVVVRSFLDPDEQRRLVAYFVPNFEHYVTLGGVRRFARDQLAEDLQPKQFVELDEMPLSDSGELDRAALLDPLAPRDTYTPPRTTTEKSIARIWQDALGIDRAGLSDNFFDLGGHSLLSTRVIVQIYKKLGVRLDQAVMVLNTLEQVAREVEQRKALETGDQPLPQAAEPSESRKGKGLLRGLLMGKKSGGRFS